MNKSTKPTHNTNAEGIIERSVPGTSQTILPQSTLQTKNFHVDAKIVTALEAEAAEISHGWIRLEIIVRDGRADRYILSRESSIKIESPQEGRNQPLPTRHALSTRSQSGLERERKTTGQQNSSEKTKGGYVC
jgi:hypothetical protein